MSKQHADKPGNPPLAIVGIGCLFPKAADVKSYWTNIREGVDAITEIPASHWDPRDYFDSDKNTPDMTYARRGGFLDPVDFDPLLYGLSPNNLEATDTTQLLGMVVARQALLDAGYATSRDSDDGRAFDRARTSVILGVTGTLELVIPLGARLGHPLWRRALAAAGVEQAVADEVVQRIAEGYVPWQENSFPGLLGNVAAGRIANRFDLGGTNCVVDAACASSLSAVHMAALELYSGCADMAISGGFDTFNDIFMYMCFSKTPALSPTGNSRPFDHNGDGTILGEGLGAIILKRLEDAQRDGDKVYAVIRGMGSSSDGRGNAIYAPSAEGQTRALKNAYKEADVSPASIELVEAHGTGTEVGDAIEAEALAGVYREDRSEGSWCAIGSVKSMIGHTKAAAGVAGLIKVALALQNKVLPPTIKVEQPLSLLQPGRAPVYVNANKRPWLGTRAQPRRAALSAFGFGGSNFHCVLEEAEAVKAQIEWDGEVLLFAFSAADKSALQAQLQNSNSAPTWAQLRAAAARSLAAFSSKHAHRLLLVITAATEREKLFNGAERMLQQDEASWRTPEGAYYGCGAAGKLAVLFPGQGAQYCNMLLDLTCQFPQLQQALIEADRLFAAEHEGQRLSDLIYPISRFNDEARRRDEEALRATQHAQPAIGASSLGAWRVLQHFGIQADALAGHSFGELSALSAAGRIDEADLCKLAMQRGALMQAGAGDRGAMLAVSASAAVVHELLEAEQLDLIIANNNAPRQVVLSGASAQIAKALPLLEKRGLRARQLPVAAAFHSSFVAAAEKPFAAFLQDIRLKKSEVSVFANASAEAYPNDEGAAKKLLAGQLASPVDFVAQIENMYAVGARTFVEVGPGNTLTGLVKSILAEKDHHAIALDASKGRKGQHDLAALLAQLAALGHQIALSRWDEGYLESYQEPGDKPALLIPISGANYVKPRATHRNKENKSTSTEKNTMPRNTMSRTMPENTMLDASSTQSQAQPSAAAAVDGGLLQLTQESILALQKMQEQTARLHQQYLEGQAAAQQAIGQLIEQQQQLLTAAPPVFSAPPPVPVQTEDRGQRTEDREHPPSTPVAAEPLAAAESPPLAQEPAATPTPTPIALEPPVTPEPSPLAQEPAEQAPAASPTPAPTEAPGYESLLLEVVAEKTGYPVEMLSMDMSLDTDLGIDSIKRVEILSALQEKLPGMQKIQPEDLGTFQLLQHIVEFLATDEGHAQDHVKQRPQAAPEIASAHSTEDRGAAPRLDSVLLEVVAEKTGYPVEMLNLDMHLDSDLGIDSIKRVEILSALQEQLPEAPVVNPEDLANLQTLQQIVDFMQSDDAAPVAVAARAAKPLADAAQAAEKEQRLYRGIVTVAPAAEAGERIALAENALVWVTDDGSALPRKLCAALAEHKLRGQVVSPTARPEQALAGLLVLAPADADDDFLQSAFGLVQSCGAALQKSAGVLASITRLGGKFGLQDLSAANPEAGGLAGLIKTAAKEWPQVHCRALDIEANRNSATLAASIVAAASRVGAPEVGIVDGAHYAPCLQRAPVPSANSKPFAPGDVVVLSGGARGVTAEVAVALAQCFHVNLLLLGRTSPPAPEPTWLSGLHEEAAIKQAMLAHCGDQKTPKELEADYRHLLAGREVQATLARIEATGVEVVYEAVDVRDAAAVAAALAKARTSLGTIAGLIHGAGVLADGLIADQTAAQFQQVYGTKVAGLRALLAASAQDALKVLAVFSSSTARFGRKGQAAYAVANEALNKMAQQQQLERPDCRIVSVNWGPWDGGMVTPALKKLFKSEGVDVIPLQAGADYLIQELAQTGPVEVVLLGAEPDMESSREKAPPENREAALSLAFERIVSLADHPVLACHVMNGKAVLPAALIMEWLAHGAIHNNPGLSFVGVNALRILKGVVLEDGASVALQIMAGQAVGEGEEGRVPVELRSGDTLHARAEVVLAGGYPSAQAPSAEEINGRYPAADGEYYHNGQLFHGEDLQGITAISACSEQGISGRAKAAPAPAQWMAQPIRSTWLADPLILDSAFQMMILWSFQQTGAGCLPTALGEYRQFQRRFPQQGVAIKILIKDKARHAATAEVEFLDGKGRLVARMEDYECVIDPSLHEAFQRNELNQLQS